MFPMTYTARATLEIGSGSVCSGRAVTTTTPSNQVRTPPQLRLLRALRPLRPREPRGPNPLHRHVDCREHKTRLSNSDQTIKDSNAKVTRDKHSTEDSQLWANNVDNWYKSLPNYTDLFQHANLSKPKERNIQAKVTDIPSDPRNIESTSMANDFILPFAMSSGDEYSPDLSLVDDLNHNLLPDLAEKDKANKTKAKVSRNFSHVRQHNEGTSRIFKTLEYNMEYDIELRKKYRQQIGAKLIVPTLSEINPRNVRRMTIGQTLQQTHQVSHFMEEHKEKHPQKTIKKEVKIECSSEMDGNVMWSNSVINDVEMSELENIENVNSTQLSRIFDISTKCYNSSDEGEVVTSLTNPFACIELDKSQAGEVELTNVNHSRSLESNAENSFNEYVSKQQKLLESLSNSEENNSMKTTLEFEKEAKCQALIVPDKCKNIVHSKSEQYKTEKECSKATCVENILVNKRDEHTKKPKDAYSMTSNGGHTMKFVDEHTTKTVDEHTAKPEVEHTAKSDRIILTQLPNNAYIFLTLPKPLVSLSNCNVNTPVQLPEIENNKNDNKSLVSESKRLNIAKKKRQKMPPEHPGSSEMKKSALDKNVLKVLLFENLFKSNSSENLSHSSGVSANTNDEVGFPVELNVLLSGVLVRSRANAGLFPQVDSAISFSCITTPEVVTSCNTTSCTAQAAVAVDAKVTNSDQ